MTKITDQDEFAKWHNARQFMAYLFTLVCLAFFGAPTIMSIRLGMDHDVAYWIGGWGIIAITVPIFIAAQHVYHLYIIGEKKLRTRYIFVVVPVVPAVLFMIIGGTYMSQARFLYGQLKADDCAADSGLPAKFHLQQAYELAFAAHAKCLGRLHLANGGQPLRRARALQSCREWDAVRDEAGQHPWKGYPVGHTRQISKIERFQYLANVEATHLCGGFCKQGPSLWSPFSAMGHEGATCAQVVAFRFLAVAQEGMILFVLGAVVLALSIPAYLLSRSFLSSMGYRSATIIA